MKKIFTLITCLALVSGVFAQTESSKKYSWGVKAGLNVSSLVGSDVSGAKMKAGFHAGLVSEYRFCNYFAAGSELLFSLQGTGVKDGGDAKLNIGYINIPMMAKFYVTEKLSIDVGPQIGFALYMKAKADGVTVTVPSDTYHTFDLSMGAGATYSFWKLFASARYNIGLVNVMKDSGNKNSVIQVSVGYKF